MISPIVSEYLTLYPAVSLDLTAGDRSIDLVEHGFDLAVNAIPPPESSVIVKHMTPWRHVLCCAPSYLAQREASASPDDLAHHNCLRFASRRRLRLKASTIACYGTSVAKPDRGHRWLRELVFAKIG